MHWRVLMMVWRRKLYVMGCVTVLVVAAWGWATFSLIGSPTTTDNGVKALDGVHTESQGLWQRLTIFRRDPKPPADPGVKFVKPTGNIPPKPQSESMMSKLDNLFSSKYVEKLRNLKVPDREDIAWRRKAIEQRALIDRQMHYDHELHRMGVPAMKGIGPDMGVIPPKQRLVHLDLKGAPPKIQYLKRLIPILKSLGATGLLLEYEDMFPYSGQIANIAARNAYAKNRLMDFLQTVKAAGLTVMPLVQTFGHMEFVLKLREFQEMRENPNSPQALCPSFNKSLLFIEEMLSQVISFHMKIDDSPTLDDEAGTNSLKPHFRSIHIGCDEVYRMGECPRCRDKSKHELFLSHVSSVASRIKSRWPGLDVVIWDDMMRQIQVIDLQDFKLGHLVQPMIWVYAEDVYHFVSPQTFDKYSMVFPTAWAASAFKGAHGETLLMPPSRRHLENTLRWLTVIQSENARFKDGIQGLALTGWQRYDHFAVLCELLPVALPSLAVSLATASLGYLEVDGRKNTILSALSCPEKSAESLSRRPWLDLYQDPDMSSFAWCMFPGGPLFRYSHRLLTAVAESKDYVEKIKYKRGWLTDYNIKHNFTSPVRVAELVEHATKLKGSLITLAKNASEVMIDIYDKFTIEEFIEQRINPVVDELNGLLSAASRLSAVKVWPRRPLPYIRVITDIKSLTNSTKKSTH
ncbi:Beta-N-acetylhexosaminidase [Sergentomyia squamirostris]